MSIRRFAVVILVAAVALGACETTEGYRQQMSTWQGRTGDDLMVAWGAPNERSTLSDGREMWSYAKSSVIETAGYYRDEKRQVTRTFTDKDGKEKTETISETFPVWQPPTSYQKYCSTRFVLSPARRIEQVSFDGDACVAAEQGR
jgi:hypothetical protein